MIKKLYLFLAFFLLTSAIITAQRPHIRSHNFTTREGLASNVVNTIIQDRQGYLWIGTNHGLTRFDGHQFANFYVEEEGESLVEGINHLVEDTTHHVLLMSGKDYRLLCFDLAQMKFISAEDMLYPATDMTEAAEAAFIARANEIGIQRGNITHRRHDMHYVQLPNGQEVFTTIDNGFYIYDSRNLKAPLLTNATASLYHFSASDDKSIIESDYINDVCLDRSGCVWLATTFAGIYQLDVDEGQMHYHPIDGSSGNFRSFSELPDSTIAVGDMDGNVFRFDPRTGQSQLIFHKGPRAYAMRTDRKGRFWVGTRGGGVWMMESEKGKVKSEKLLDVPARQVFDVCLASDGTAWIGTFDGGLIEAKEKPDGTFNYTTFLPEEKVHQMLIDRRGRLWVATENGIFRKDEADFTPIYNKGKVVCLTQGPADTVYAGSNGYGLLIIADNHVEQFTTSDGLANNCVEAIAVDSCSHVIAATDQGISIINFPNNTVQNIYSPLGLLADTYNEDAIICTSEGRTFLGSQRGLAELLESEKGIVKSYLLPPCITTIDINDVPHYEGISNELHLQHYQNNLSFSCSSFAYKDLSSVIYSYWLEGFDRDWRPATRDYRALYTELKPGHYRFHVRYHISGGQWSPETVCDINIAQPWWWTWQARVLYLILLVLFLWYEWHQYQQRLSLRRQLDQRLTALYAVEMQREHVVQEERETEEREPEERETEETAQQKAASQRNKDFLDKLDNLILQNLLQTDLDVNFIAQEMCVSYSTLHRRIKSLTGITANEYVRKHRLTKAMQLLRDGHNATEVAMQCGFNSPSYFTRCFKAEYGILPSEV